MKRPIKCALQVTQFPAIFYIPYLLDLNSPAIGSKLTNEHHPRINATSNQSDKRGVYFKFENSKKTKYQGGFNPVIYSIKKCKGRELITDVVYRNLPKSVTFF